MSTIMKLESLPNEIFIECFQYLDTLDILYSFDRLNYRFHLLIQNISLHLNLHHYKKSSFDQFYEIILTNSEIKQYIISLQLSNVYAHEQIKSFIPILLLNEFIYFRSLSLIELKDDNTKQVLPILSFLSDIECFFLY
ncbi:unnamed protein product [Rotaria sp. Silwood2]|nr:unnamed protein product [Rotaria sp. Silwood2]